jgi:hypothetical protein
LITLNADLVAAQQLAEVRRLSAEGANPDPGSVSANYGNLVATISGSDETVVHVESANKPPVFGASDVVSTASAEAEAPRASSASGFTIHPGMYLVSLVLLPF